MHYLKSRFYVIAIFLSIGFISSCLQRPQQDLPTQKITKNQGADEVFIDKVLDNIYPSTAYIADLKEIKARDTLKVITISSSTSYFLYKGQPMGYEYELSKKLADYLDLNLEIVVADNLDEILDLLIQGKGDLVAYNLTITSTRRDLVNFTVPLNFTHQVLVQRKPDNWRKMKLHEIEDQLVRNPIEMIGIPIHIRENSSYSERLNNLSNELGEPIKVNYLSGEMTTGEILQKVHNKEIDYTIADYNIANINAAYYHNLDIETTVGVMQQLAWAVRKTSPQLKKTIDDWLIKHRRSKDFNVLYNKYFKNNRAFVERNRSEYFTVNSQKISEFDPIIKETATDLNWDWRFLAALINQESRFNPKEKSWVGAVGLMQLMPKTAKSYGYSKLTNPKTNLAAGMAHIEYLDQYWRKKIPDSTERIKFVLASYNAGHNHVRDARKLAIKYDMNADIWYENVEKAMLMKSKKKFFNDPVVNYGYCRGEEPVNYVEEIFQTYNYYKEFTESS